MDEVESLSSARRTALASNEPTDAIRVVNALLTELDALRRHPNVLVLTTSNLLDAMDAAFLDRVDLCQLVPYPSTPATYCILRSCVLELMHKGLVAFQVIKDRAEVQLLREACMAEEGISASSSSSSSGGGGGGGDVSFRLWDLAAQAQGRSGRALRKLPFMAYAFHAAQGTRASGPGLEVGAFLDALEVALAELGPATQA